ncbi:MAG: hypothetical protein IPK07_07370 [Deltaproteobacteria bacterium]|nr:hypothetical protein [Deltaproteobacteria bacterium]
MALSLRELLELERTRRAHVDQAFGGIADAVRSIAAASLRIEDNLRGFSTPAAPPASTPPAPPSPTTEPEPRGPGEHAQRRLDQLVDESSVVAARLLAVVDIADQLDRRLGAAREIAERIDILALNAALDATRSDPGTRGVARSASEIRDQVVGWIRATQDLAPLAAEIRQEAGRAVLAADALQRRAAGLRGDGLGDGPPAPLAQPTPVVGSPGERDARAIAAASDPTLEHAEVIAGELRALGNRLEALLLGSGQ